MISIYNNKKIDIIYINININLIKMKPIWFVGISPGNKFFYDPQNILKLISKAPIDYRIVITSPLELHKINMKCRRLNVRKERQQYRHCCNKINNSITNIKNLNRGYEFIEWKHLENIIYHENNIKIIMNDKDLFPQIYSTTDNIIQKISKEYNKEPPTEELIMYGTTYLVNELAVLMELKNTLRTDKCIISYPNRIDVVDYFIKKYCDDWLKIKYL